MTVPFRRLFAEKRGWIVQLGVVFLANIGVYGLAVYPLSVRVARAETRVERAAVELAAAQRDSASALAAETARDRATDALEQFYAGVLPHDLAAASRVTYLRLAQMGRKLNLRVQRRSYESEDPERDSKLGRLKISMTLTGDYESMREFIYELEADSEFVVIEDIVLSEGAEVNAPLTLTLTLATYYPAEQAAPDAR